MKEIDELRAKCEARAKVETAANRAEEKANRKAAHAAEQATS